ncbi:MAG TPA: hypothetical protein VKG44_00900, partial [Candidatus Baltobacteraceae bacterium]|nr:hypothetical protein [Candidatus Baltobacteraceae bacterium]
MTRSAQAGFTLLEALLAVALLAGVVVVLGSGSLAQRPGALGATSSALPALVARARALAESSGDGATLAFAPQPDGFGVTLYAYRPIAGSPFGASSIAQRETYPAYVTSSAGSGAFAIFISSAGTASYAAWSPASGALASEPACDAPLSLVIG